MEIKTIIFWVLVALFVAPSFYFGFIKMIAQQAKIDQFKVWGFPMWFMRGLGFVEIAAAVAIIFPETRLYGIIAWAIILTGAIYVNLKNREPRAEVIVACVVSVQVLFIYLLAYQF
jgi:putative oxidoreductase